MHVSITIRNVPQEVRDALAAKAARSGRSLQEHLLGLLAEMAHKPSVEDLMAQVRTRKELTDTRLSAKEILRNRDADRR